MRERERESVCVCVCMRVCVCVCVCVFSCVREALDHSWILRLSRTDVCVREGERAKECVCVCERERERAKECVCVCVCIRACEALDL